MRILVLSDLHYKLPHYDWLVEAAAQVDAVAIVGDLADVVSPVPHEVQTVVVGSYLGRLAERTTVLAASGNHDLDGPGAHGEQVAAWLRRSDHAALHVDGMSVDVGETRFTVCPWWDGPISRDEVAAQLAAAAVDRPQRWVWLYHAPPAGTPLCHDGRRTFPTRSWPTGSPSTSRTSCSAATSISRPGPRAVRGMRGSVRPGCSTRASRSARCPRTSRWTPTRRPRTGTASTSRRRSPSLRHG